MDGRGEIIQDPNNGKELFSATLHEIDKEISKFDSQNHKFGGKYDSGSASIPPLSGLLIPTDDFCKLLIPKARDTTYSPIPFVITSSIVTEVPIPVLADPPTQASTWKRLVISGPRADSCLEKPVTSKRLSSTVNDLAELPCKCRLVSLSDKANNDKLAGAVQQSCQKQ